MEEEDDGFLGYVPSTVDPGPILLVAVVATVFFLLAVLPFAVVLGDKYEGLEQRTRDSHTDGDEVEQDEANNADPQSKSDQRDQEDDSSVSSKETSAYSVISDAVREMMDRNGRPIRSGSRMRHKRRHRGHAERGHLMQYPDQYSMQLTDSLESEAPGEITLSVRGESNIHGPSTGPQMINDCGLSELGAEMKVEGIKEKPVIDRNVCLSTEGFFDEIAAIMAWDIEMKRIIKLSIPFATQALFTGTLDTLTVGVVGKLVGTREVSAFVVVNLLVSLTTKFVGGFYEALATLCSQAIGAKKPRLAGKYVQIATLLYMLFYIPFALIWACYLGAAIRWFGFDEETVRIGHQYGYVLLVDLFIDGVGEAIHGLLDVSGFANWSTFIGALEEVIAFLTILVWALLGSPTLLMVGIVQFGMGVVFLSANVIIIWRNGWFHQFRGGMIETWALADKMAVKLVCKTAMSISFGYLLTDGEWELLTIFASFLGPAEVAAWGIFGTIWDAVNELIDGIADASEIRCAFLLGSDQPERARLSAHKSLMIGVFTALFITSILFMCGEDLPTWLTNDPTLQHLLRDLLPMFGIGNAAACVGCMSWTLLGAQGRYRLATVVVFFVSWFFTLPLAAVFSVHLNLTLEGQTAAVCLGYFIAGAIHTYYLFRSDWVQLSFIVMDDNCSRASDDSSVQDVPTGTKTEDNDEDMTENSITRASGEQVRSKDEASPAPKETALPRLPSVESTVLTGSSSSSLVHQRGGLPCSPSGEGSSLFHGYGGVTGSWHIDRTESHESVEVEIY